MFYERPLRTYSLGVTSGETATPEEIADATWDSMRLVENANSRRVALERAYDARIDAIFQSTGQRLANPERIDVRHRLARAGHFGPLQQDAPNLHAEFQTELGRLAEQYPDLADIIRADRPVIEDARRLSAEAEHRFENVWARSDGGFYAWANRLGAGFGATLTDPINVVTAATTGPFGAAGPGVRGLLWYGIKAGAANAGAEALIQPFVQSWRKEAGLPYGFGLAATNVAAAGLFGFGLDAGVRSTVRGFRRAIGRPYLGPEPDSRGGPLTGGPADPLARLEEAARAAPEGSPLRKAAELDTAALREVAEASGAIEDPAVRGGLARVETDDFFRGLRPDDVDNGEHLRQLSAAIRRTAGLPDALPAGEALKVPPARKAAPDLSDERTARIGETETVEGKPVQFRALDPSGIVADPATFQFKSGGDAAGVTERLRSVKRWDPVSAGKAVVFERLNGELVIADGHQRLGLARRLSADGQAARLHAYVFREADGWTPADVRAHAALKNMRELSGSSVDMARVMRERPDLVDDSLPMSDGKLREAAMLARLSPEAFDAIIAGRLPAPVAALIGDHVADSSRHIGLLNELAAADLANLQQARFYLAQLMELPTTVETQITLFGEEAITRTLMVERSRVLDASLRSLKSDRRIFGLLEREAGRIAEGGNVLARESNVARAQNAAELGELIERLVTTRGVVATLLNDASIAVSRGLSAPQASRAFVRRIGDILDKEGINGLLKTGDDAPPAGGRLDDPAGAEAKAQVAALENDADQGLMFALSAGGRGDWETQLSRFLASEFRNDWINGEGFKIYVRKTLRPDPQSGEGVRTLDIASVEVGRAERGQGTFKDVLASAEKIARQSGIRQLYVENVLTEQFANFFRQAGWVEERAMFPGEPPSFTRRVEDDTMFALGTAGQETPLFDDLLRTLQERADVRSRPDAGAVDPRFQAGGQVGGRGAGAAPGGGRGARGGRAGEGARAGRTGATEAADAAFRTAASQGLDETRFALGQRGEVFPGRTIRRGSYVLRIDSEGERWRGQPTDSLTMYIYQATGVDETTAPVDALGNAVGYILLNRTEDGRTRVGMVRVGEAHRGSRAAYYLIDTAMKEFGLPRYPDSVLLEPMYQQLRRIFTEVEDWWRKWGHAWLSPREIKRTLDDKRARVRRLERIRKPDLQHRINTDLERKDVQELEALWNGLPDEAKTPEQLEKMFALDRGPDADNVVSLRGEHVVRADLKPLKNPGRNVQQFIGERLTSVAKSLEEIETATSVDKLYDAYRNWTIETRSRVPVSKSEFVHLMRENGIAQARIAGQDRFGAALRLTDEQIRRNSKLAELYGQLTKIEKEIADQSAAIDELSGREISFASRRAMQIGQERLGNLQNSLEGIRERITTIEAGGDAVQQAPWSGHGTLTPRFADAAADIRADIDKVMNRILPPSWRHEVRDRLVYRGRAVEGYADFKEQVVYVSLAALDPLERAFEEAGHALRQFIPAADYDILRAEAQRLGARQFFDIDNRYGETYGRRAQGAELDALLEEEAIMQMVAAHARGRKFGEPTTAAGKIMDRIAKFFRAVVEALHGRGFRTYDDVFEDLVSGRMARADQLPEVKAASRAAALRDVMFNTAGGGARRPGTIPDLINGALAEGHISREEADGMLSRFEMLEAHYRDNPVQAAEQLAQELDAEALRRQRLALLRDQAQERIEAFVTGYRDARGQPDPAKAMIAVLEHHGQTLMPDGASSVVGRRNAITGLYMGRLEGILHEFRRTWVLGGTRNRARLENLVREAFGERTGDQAAADFARAWAQVAEELRQRFNAGGGQIGRLRSWGLPQHHDRRALLSAGMETWIGYIAPRLDLAAMRNHLTGLPMTPADLRASLEYIWRNITADGWVEREPSMVRFGIGIVANQRADHRFLHFRNPGAWLEYQAEFGGGADPFAAMMNHIRGMAEDIAAMEILGPNPRGMLTWLQQLTLQQAALRASGQPALFPTVAEITGRRMAAAGNWLTTKGAEDYARNAVTLTDNMWDIYRGAAGAVVNERVADVFGTVRNLNVASKLGGAALSAVTDLGFAKMARYFAGLPVTRTWGDMLRAFAVDKRDAVRGGLILDSAANILHQEARWAGSMQGPEWSSYLADRVIASTGLAAWTQAGKHAFGLSVQAELASRTGQSFAALPQGLQRFFGRYGLTAADWDAIRATAAGDPDFLTPTMVQASGVENLAERYLEMILQETEYAVPTGGLKAQAMSYGGLRRGVARDEFWRSAGQFKMFGLSVAMLQGQRIAQEIIANGGLRGAGYAAGLLITTTLYGALAIQLKEIAKGRDARPMDDAKFWGHAVLQSGGLGIYGDFLFAETNRVGGGLARTLVGPTADVAAGLLALGPGNIAQKVRGEKTNTGREIVRFLAQNTPGGSNWYLRLAYERVLLDNLQRLVDPEAEAAFQRKIQQQRREYRNEFFWAPGETPPRRAPRLFSVR